MDLVLRKRELAVATFGTEFLLFPSVQQPLEAEEGKGKVLQPKVEVKTLNLKNMRSLAKMLDNQKPQKKPPNFLPIGFSECFWEERGINFQFLTFLNLLLHLHCGHSVFLVILTWRKTTVAFCAKKMSLGCHLIFLDHQCTFTLLFSCVFSLFRGPCGDNKR